LVERLNDELRRELRELPGTTFEFTVPVCVAPSSTTWPWTVSPPGVLTTMSLSSPPSAVAASL
jgi:hypothetical protein